MVIALLLACAAPGVHVVVDVAGIPRPAAASAPAVVDAASREAALGLFRTRCALCHGVNGQGDGPSAMGLPQKPRRFSDAVWQSSVADDDITRVILGGGAARKLSVLMPPNLDLKDKPAVVKALVSIIRALKSPMGTARVTLTSSTPSSAKAASADAGADGSAHVDVDGVAPGKYALRVEVAPGVAACEVPVEVGAVDVHVPCAISPKQEKSP